MIKKLLVVEDEKILLDLLKDRFEEEGYKVKMALDGDGAISMVEKDPPDLILLDLILPKKNGFEVLKELKGNPTFSGIPIIVLSNLGADNDIKEALKLGAKDYFVKTQHPIEEIVEKVKAL